MNLQALTKRFFSHKPLTKEEKRMAIFEWIAIVLMITLIVIVFSIIGWGLALLMTIVGGITIATIETVKWKV